MGSSRSARSLPIAPSTYHAHVAKRTDPKKLSTRAKQDLTLTPEIARVFAENFEVYGVRKVWRQLQRESFDVARCTVGRPTRGMGLRGVIAASPCNHDQRQGGAVPIGPRIASSMRRPECAVGLAFRLRSTWTGFVDVAFVIDAYARRIVGWRTSRTAHASFVLDALEQALHDRQPAHRGGLVHHSDRGSQYVSIKYTERLAEAGIEPSVGSVGDSYDNALAETINSLYKAEVIHRRGSWRTMEAVEFATSWLTGSTIAGCWSLSATSRRSSRGTLLRRGGRNRRWRRDFKKIASGNPGAVHNLLHDRSNKLGSRDPALFGHRLQIFNFQRNNDILDGHRAPPMAPTRSFGDRQARRELDSPVAGTALNAAAMDYQCSRALASYEH